MMNENGLDVRTLPSCDGIILGHVTHIHPMRGGKFIEEGKIGVNQDPVTSLLYEPVLLIFCSSYP